MRYLSPAFALLMLAACGEPQVEVDTLDAPGPYAVGVRTLEVEYRPPLTLETRTLQTVVWYPAEAAEGERPFYVLRSSEVATIDAPPLTLGPRPVVVFSHGHQAYAAAMSRIMEHLASHGYVVIAPTHTGNTFLDGDNRETDIYYLRTYDLKAALDHVAGLGDGLSALVSETRVVAGHSFGAYTAFAVAGAEYPVDDLDDGCAAGTVSSGYCSTLDDEKRELFAAGFEDDRFSAVLSYDPGDFGLFGEAGVAKVDVPTLHVVAEISGHPVGDPAADDYWRSLNHPDDFRFLLKGGDHNDFTDACEAGLDVRCSTLIPERVWSATRIYTLAFLDGVVLGEPGYEDILSGAAEVSSLAEVTDR